MPGRASRSLGSPTGPRTPAWRRFGGSQQQWSFSFSSFLQSLMQSESFTHILRVLNTNVDGKEKIMYALTSIRGIGRRFSNICVKKAEVDLNRRCVALKGWRPLDLACRSGGLARVGRLAESHDASLSRAAIPRSICLISSAQCG